MVEDRGSWLGERAMTGGLRTGAARGRRRWLASLLGGMAAILSGLALAPRSADAACPATTDPDLNYSCPIGPNYVIPALPNNLGWDKPAHYENILYGDIDGGGAQEMVARGVDGVEVFRFRANLGQWSQVAVPPILSDRGGWSAPDRYRTLRLGDIDGDHRSELVVRSANGMVVFRYSPGHTADGGHWVQLNQSGPFAGAIWNKPEYYSTISLLPIASSAAKPTMQLVGRGPQGLEVFRWNGAGWETLPRLSALSDAAGFGDPDYYRSITAWDGSLLFARGPRGVEVFRYSARDFDPWRSETKSGPCAQVPPADSFPCKTETIQLVHGVKGAGTDPVLIAADARGFGLRGARYIMASHRWQDLRSLTDPRNTPWSNSGAELVDTVQTADLAGDGIADVVGRLNGGIAVFAPEIGASGTLAFDRLSLNSPELAGAPWGDRSSYRTITTAKLLPDSSARYLLARGRLGFRTWRWQPDRSSFVRPRPYGSFPGVDVLALRAMTAYLGIAHGSLRDAYTVRTADPSAEQLAHYATAIEKTCTGSQAVSPPRFASCAPPASAKAGVSSQAWTTTANQVLSELFWARSVVDYFSQLNRIQSELFLDQRAQFPALESELRVAASPNLVTKLNIGNLVGSILGIVGGLPIPVVSPVAGVIGGALSLVAAGTPVGEGREAGEIDVRFSELHTRIARFQHEMRDSITNQRRQVLSDYGLLGAVGQMVSARVWRLDGQAALSAGREGLTRTIYHSVLPSLWDRWIVTSCDRLGFVCNRPSTSKLVREQKTDDGWDFDGILPKQTPCEPIFLTIRGNCTFKSLEESDFRATEHVLIEPISPDCIYDPEAGTSWHYGCSLGVSPEKLLEGPPNSAWDFRVRRCDWATLNGSPPSSRTTCQTAQD
jgi:hypothetical protein